VRAAVESKRLTLADRIDRRVAECEITLYLPSEPRPVPVIRYLAAVQSMCRATGRLVLRDAANFPVMGAASTSAAGDD